MNLKNTYLGFTNSLTPMQKSRVETCLDKLIRSEGIIYTNKEFTATRLQEGYSLTIEENETHYNRKLDIDTKPRTLYHMELRESDGKFNSSYTIEKTLYNFALYLQENNLVNQDNINSYVILEVAKVEAELKAIEDQELKEKQAEEFHEQQKQDFKMWLNIEAENYKDTLKISLSKEIFLNEINQYNEIHVNSLLVLIDNINNPMCREALKSRLWSGNKSSKKVFSCVTGVILPATDKGTMEILNTITQGDYTGMLIYKKRKEAEEVQLETFYKLMTIPEFKFEECLGEVVNKYGLNMFLCKEKKGYTISDIKSGCQITSGTTKNEIYEKLKTSIEKTGIEVINKFIGELIEKYGVSPAA
ncbi:hypothetical protein [Clostridium sp.]|uniref:hypothetical protein n=1 Tax=Clostridium sp. TaxID=1506 RepID=UPI001A597578|nr:hypothetical protein [Clostridium sp.]MBK5239779.1 hypothetical protein [Clostridium sp.]